MQRRQVFMTTNNIDGNNKNHYPNRSHTTRWTIDITNGYYRKEKKHMASQCRHGIIVSFPLILVIKIFIFKHFSILVSRSRCCFNSFFYIISRFSSLFFFIFRFWLSFHFTVSLCVCIYYFYSLSSFVLMQHTAHIQILWNPLDPWARYTSTKHAHTHTLIINETFQFIFKLQLILNSFFSVFLFFFVSLWILSYKYYSKSAEK